MNRIRGRKLQERRARWFSQYPLCVDCEAEGITRFAQELDHIIPLHQGGVDDESNLAGRCKEHHLEKSMKERGKNRKPQIGLDGYPIERA